MDLFFGDTVGFKLTNVSMKYNENNADSQERSSFGRGVKSFLFTNQTVGQTAAKNTFWLGISNLGGRLIKAALIVYSARVLGAAEWGLFSYAVSLAAFITIFTDFGIGPILTKEAARATDPEKRAEIVSTTFFIKLVLSSIGILIVLFAAPHFSSIKEASFLFPIIALIIVFDTLQGFGFSLTRALERMELEAAFYLLTNVSIVIFGFLALHFYPEVIYFSYAYAAGIAVGAGATIFSLRKHLKNLFLNFRRRLVRPIMGAAWPFVVSGLLGSLMINTDILLIGFFLSAEQVGIYSAADRPIQILYLLPAIIATSVFPILSRIANKDVKKTREVLEKILSLAYLVSIPLVLGGIVLGGDIIRVFFGSQYTGAVMSFRILLATLSINFAAVIFTNAIFAHDKQRDLIKFAALGGIANVILDIILIPKFGITGSAFATLFAQIIGNIYIWRKMQTIVSFSVLPKLKKIAFSAIIMALIVFGLHRWGLNLFLNVAVGAVIYLGLLYLTKEQILKDIKLILRPSASVGLENSEPAA